MDDDEEENSDAETESSGEGDHAGQYLSSGEEEGSDSENSGNFHVEIHINYSCMYMIGGSSGHMLAAEKILKIWCSLVRFGIHFDQIVS